MGLRHNVITATADQVFRCFSMGQVTTQTSAYQIDPLATISQLISKVSDGSGRRHQGQKDFDVPI